MKLSKIITQVAEVKIRMGNGIGIISFIKNSIYVGAGLTIIFKLDVAQSVIASLLALISFYIIGAVDLKWIKLMQEEAKLSSGKYNPYFKQKLGKIERFK